MPTARERERRAAVSPDRFEYMRMAITASPEVNADQLNHHGQAGWQLIHVGSLHYWLMRRLTF
jgi:hypothetical protein